MKKNIVIATNPPLVDIDPSKDQIIENHQVVWVSTLYLDKPELDFGNFKCISKDDYNVGDTVYIEYTSNEDMWYEIITEEEYNLVIDY